MKYETHFLADILTILRRSSLIQASCERTSKCADSAIHEVTDPEPEP